MKNNNESESGFGLLEVIIASGVLIMVITSSVALSRMAIRSNVVSLERVQAYNLAQEGIEKVRQVRDTNWVDKDPVTDWKTNLLPTTNPETVPLNNKDFTRTISIADITDTELGTNLLTYGITNTQDTIKKVNVTVAWKEYDIDWKIDLVTYLTDWKAKY